MKPLFLYSTRCVCIAILSMHVALNAYTQNAAGTTISFDISIQKNSGKSGREETYNGGVQTIFNSCSNTRIRLFSLMRVQSIFFTHTKDKLQKAIVVKESGKTKYRFQLTPENWELYNKKYAAAICDTSSTDSLEVAGYRCRKATISLDEERSITAYYTTQLTLCGPAFEPAFRGIKGTVLKYELLTPKGTISYTASAITKGIIASNIFKIPTKIPLRKYQPGKKFKPLEEEPD